MEFTENFRKSDNFRIDGQMLYIIDENGRELEIFIGEEVRNARWTDEGRLLVTLENGAVRWYEDEVNYIISFKNSLEKRNFHYKICFAWSLVLTLVMMSSIMPFSSIIKFVLSIPSYSLPIDFFGALAPYASIIVLSSSAING